MDFSEFSVEDRELLRGFLNADGENSCENSFINLYVWQKLYGNRYAICDDMLFLKSGTEGNEFFALPFGGDIIKGVERIREHTGCLYPVFWAQDGKRFEDFCQAFGDEYIIKESRSDADYIYLREDLAELRGKKYHSKRNHISAFSKQFDWKYETINSNNIGAVKDCAELWYKENEDRLDEEMKCEKQGVFELLAGFDALDLSGGAIVINEKVVAFTLGSPINNLVFDIHIEKALSEFAGAYSVINREFARSLTQYTFLNREDDLGLEGLRKAKLSYHPTKLLNKYICYPKHDSEKSNNTDHLKEIYQAAFGISEPFDSELFSRLGNCIKTLEKGGEIVSMLFLLPCKLNAFGKSYEAFYIYAAATSAEHRGKGYMTELINKICLNNEAFYFLKPASNELAEFYKKLGFLSAECTTKGDVSAVVSVTPEHEHLHNSYCDCPENYIIMYRSNVEISGRICFEFPME